MAVAIGLGIGALVSGCIAGSFTHSAVKDRKIHNHLKSLPIHDLGTLPDSGTVGEYRIVTSQVAGPSMISPLTPLDTSAACYYEKLFEVRMKNKEVVRNRFNDDGVVTGFSKESYQEEQTMQLGSQKFVQNQFRAIFCKSFGESNRTLRLSTFQATPLFEDWTSDHLSTLRIDDHKQQDEKLEVKDQKYPPAAPGTINFSPVISNIGNTGATSGGVGTPILPSRFVLWKKKILIGQQLTAIGKFKPSQFPGEYELTDTGDSYRPTKVSVKDPENLINEWKESSNNSAIFATLFGIGAVGLLCGAVYNK